MGRCLVALVVTACASPAPRPSTMDDLGRPITLTRPATRVVSLAPSITELLYAIGAGHTLVGRSKWDEYPAEVSAVPSVGDGLAPNVEAVAARKPDLVLLYASPSNATALGQFDHLGIPAVNFRMDRLDDVSRLARAIGRLTGVERAADSLAGAFDVRLDSARLATRTARDSGPGVLLLAWTDPPNVLGAASFVSEIVALAGAHNVFADLPQPSATVTIEAIAARKPDVVLTLDSTVVLTLSARPEWRAVGAIRERRFVVVHGSEFGQPSFRALKAVEQLRAALAREVRAR